MKKFISVTLMALIMNGCSVKSDDVQPVRPPVNVEPYSQTVFAGPYEVQFDINNRFSHIIRNSVSTSDARVEYYISPTTSTWVWVDYAQSGVTGCSASSVIHEMYWIKDSRYPSDYKKIKVGEPFYAYQGFRGILVHNFKGLYGCFTVELSSRLSK